MSKKQKQHQAIIPGNAMAIKVIGPSREDLGYAIKGWKRKVKNAGIIESVRDRKEFIKPSVKKRQQHQAAVFMQYVRNLHAN
jgi:ribosomal protein S21